MADGQAMLQAANHDISYKVCWYCDSAGQVAHFRNANRSSARDAAYFDWRYNDVPCAIAPMVALATDSSGALVGAASIIPHDMQIGALMAPVGIVGDVSVSAACRGRGVAQGLMTCIAEAELTRQLGGCMVLPNEALDKPLRRAGWQEVGRLARFICPTGAPGKGNRSAAATASRWWARASEHLSLRGARRDGPAVFEVSPVSEFGAEFDRLWEQLRQQQPAMTCRDARSLQWRYANKPGALYQIATLRRADRLVAWAVHHREGLMLVVDDFLAIDTAAARRCSGLLLRYAHSEGSVSAVQARFNTRAGLYAGWWRYGFVRRSDSQPVMWIGNGSAQHHAQVTAPWYFTPGDKDV